MFITIFSAILTLIAGIGIFLIACQMMSSNLESASSKRLKALFAKASKSRLIGVGIGTVGTAAIQSSGATTVMVIGFVNAGIISLTQAATIIYGANIGTTVTAQIVALGMFGGNSISTSLIFSSFAGLGAFISMFSDRESLKRLGGILTGFGMLFVGLEMMSGSMEHFAALEGVKTFLSGIDNALVLTLLGVILTAIIQSSSVMTSIALAMVVSGLVSLEQGIYLTMGSNIGSCVVAIIAGMTSGKNAKRTALIHLLFNCSGVAVFLVLGWVVSLATGGSVTFGTLFDSLFPGAPQTQLAMFHTVFNVATVVVILPATDFLVRTVCSIIKDTDEAEDPAQLRLFYLDRGMLKTPPVAVEQTKREIVHMGSIAIKNFNRSLDIVSTLDFSEQEAFQHDEQELNFLNRSIVDFVVLLSGQRVKISEKDHVYLATTFRTVRDIERIGDYAENIIEYAQMLRGTNQHFSDQALGEISELRELVNSLYVKALDAYEREDLDSLEDANLIEDRIDDFTKSMEDHHILRLSEGICTPAVGAQYLSLSTNVERIADHLINVAKTIRSLKTVRK